MRFHPAFPEIFRNNARRVRVTGERRSMMLKSLLAAALYITCHLSAQTDSAFITWARDHSVRFDSSGKAFRMLDHSIAGARLIGVGESVHETQPFITFRFRLLQDLVRRHRVTALVIESGLPEMMTVDEYVRGRRATVDYGSIPGGYGDLEEFRRAMEWLRSWNLGPGGHHPVSVYGADLSGRAGSMLPALDRLRELTHGLDNVGSLIDSVQWLASKVSSTWWKGAARMYDSLSSDQKAALTSGVTRLVERVGDLSGEEHKRLAWAQRLAVLVHQSENTLRLGAFSPSAPRDQAMAENVLWVLGALPEGERAVYWAHNAHVQKVPVRGPRLPPGNFPSAGTRLATALGMKYFAIGTAYGGLSMDTHAVADSGSVDAALEKVGTDQFLLPLHTGPGSPSVDAWLSAERPMRFQVGYVIVPLGTAFDAVAYFDHAVPAVRAPASE